MQLGSDASLTYSLAPTIVFNHYRMQHIQSEDKSLVWPISFITRSRQQHGRAQLECGNNKPLVLHKVFHVPTHQLQKKIF